MVESVEDAVDRRDEEHEDALPVGATPRVSEDRDERGGRDREEDGDQRGGQEGRDRGDRRERPWRPAPRRPPWRPAAATAAAPRRPRWAG